MLVQFHRVGLHQPPAAASQAGRSGWISTSSCIAEAALDVRNHLEFQPLGGVQPGISWNEFLS